MQYRFGDCRLDTASREFVCGAAAVHLSPKAFDLLRVLIEQRPRVLSKAELMQVLWPNTFVVEGNLPVLVAEVRDALGDRVFASTAIKTHHGIGYSFAIEVDQSRSGHEAHLDGPRLIIKIGPRHIALAPGINGVGRDPQCDVYINDVSVSRSHARITVQGRVATVLDLGSKNGTRVGGTTITGPTPLNDGDVVQFGSVETRFTVSEHRDPPSTVTL